jgi:hypothetical protein
VKANKSSLKLGNCSKLVARYCGPFENLERIGPVDYMLAFPTSTSIHNVLCVSFLKKYIIDANRIIDWNVIQVEKEGAFQVLPMCILDWKIKKIKNRSIGIIKVQWNWYGPKDVTWEHEDAMQTEYPHIFEYF